MTRAEEILKAAKERKALLQKESAAHWQQTKKDVEANMNASKERILSGLKKA